MTKTITTPALRKINTFFETYAKALEGFDVKLMVNHYAFPCLFVSDESSSSFTDPAKLEGLFNTAISFYKKYGIVHARPEIWSKRNWTDKIVKVKVNWQYYNADNQPLYNCDYQYIVKADKNSNWKIEVAVAINEKERIEEWEKSNQN